MTVCLSQLYICPRLFPKYTLSLSSPDFTNSHHSISPPAAFICGRVPEWHRSDPAASTRRRDPTPTTEFEMEHGSLTDARSSTFSLIDEDHTLANSVRFTLNQDPRVEFCGYSIPHPSENRVNIRVQTTGDPAKVVLKDALQNLMAMCKHVRTTFDKSVGDFRVNQPPPQNMDIDSQQS